MISFDKIITVQSVDKNCTSSVRFVELEMAIGPGVQKNDTTSDTPNRKTERLCFD